MNVLSLFSGVGGLDLGLERAGMTVVGQVEIDLFCQRVLAKHWPEVPRHDDVRTAADWWQSTGRPTVDLIAGGFPCQPFSLAGHQRGIADERWMWPAMADVVRRIQPRWILVENTTSLIRDRTAFGWLLGDLAALGFDAEWTSLSACLVGAPHTRDRLFLVAHTHPGPRQTGLGAWPQQYVARPEGWFPTGQALNRRARAWRDRVDRSLETARADGRETDGSARQTVSALGNAVVPQVAEHVGRLIMAAHHRAAHPAEDVS